MYLLTISLGYLSAFLAGFLLAFIIGVFKVAAGSRNIVNGVGHTE
jgi:ABC-type uncharacterized transport system permease subunit